MKTAWYTHKIGQKRYRETCKWKEVVHYLYKFFAHCVVNHKGSGSLLHGPSFHFEEKIVSVARNARAGCTQCVNSFFLLKKKVVSLLTFNYGKVLLMSKYAWLLSRNISYLDRLSVCIDGEPKKINYEISGNKLWLTVLIRQSFKLPATSFPLPIVTHINYT